MPDPQVHARQLEQAALARKRVEAQKQRQEAQRVEQQKVAEQRAQHLELQRQQVQADVLVRLVDEIQLANMLADDSWKSETVLFSVQDLIEDRKSVV